MKLRLLTLGALLWLLLSPACAQMTFTLSGGLNFSDYAERNALDGSTTVTLPSGTNLNGLITAVKIDGVTVEASDIIPNPTQTKINYDEKTCGSPPSSSPTATQAKVTTMTEPAPPNSRRS